MEKDKVQNLLIETGRKIIIDKGSEALTVRKLSEASGCSVGTIYNQFSNMDNFIVIQNYITLENLSARLENVKKIGNPFVDLNKLLETFVDFVLENKNLWYMLHTFHMRDNTHTYSYLYLRKIVKITGIINPLLRTIVPNMEKPERILSAQVLWISLFSLSTFLTKDILDAFPKINKKLICSLLLDTYLAGLMVLEKKS